MAPRPPENFHCSRPTDNPLSRDLGSILIFPRRRRMEQSRYEPSSRAALGSALVQNHHPQLLIMSSHTRREFAKLALAALPGAGLFSAVRRLSAAEAPARPDSKVAGVQIGLNVPYSFANATMSGDDILKNCLQLGLSAVELRIQPVESFLGVSANLINPKSGGGGNAAANADELEKLRKSVSMERVKEFRTKYEAAGVLIEIVKVDGIFKMTDDELDYAFALARALGGRAISTEISHQNDELKRIGQFAAKHQFLVDYHCHGTYH